MVDLSSSQTVSLPEANFLDVYLMKTNRAMHVCQVALVPWIMLMHPRWKPRGRCCGWEVESSKMGIFIEKHLAWKTSFHQPYIKWFIFHIFPNTRTVGQLETIPGRRSVVETIPGSLGYRGNSVAEAIGFRSVFLNPNLGICWRCVFVSPIEVNPPIFEESTKCSCSFSWV